jgi:hypothetical protein
MQDKRDTIDDVTSNLAPSFYDEDFVAWTQHQATMLREGKWDKMDLLNLAEEIESLGNSVRRELTRCPFHKFAASQAAARLYGLGGYKARSNR